MSSNGSDTEASLPSIADPRTRQMYDHYATGATLQEVGRRFRLTRERVRQIFQEANLPTRSITETLSLRHKRLLERSDEVAAAFARYKDVNEVARRLNIPRVVVNEIVANRFPPTERRRHPRPIAPKYPTSELIAFLQEASAKTRGPLSPSAYRLYAQGRQTCDRRSWPSIHTYTKRFGSLRKALIRAGLPVNPRVPSPSKRKFSDEDCIQALRTAAQALGKAPTLAEYDAFAKASGKTLPGQGTVRNRCGTWYEALAKASL